MQQVIIGLDTAELLSEMESEIDFGIDEMDDEDSDDEDDDDSKDDAEDGDYNEVAIVSFSSLCTRAWYYHLYTLSHH